MIVFHVYITTNVLEYGYDLEIKAQKVSKIDQEIPQSHTADRSKDHLC